MNNIDSLPERYEDVICGSCNGKGYRMSCPDDICRNTGECRHGNGYSKCFECGGDGYLTFDTLTNKIVDWKPKSNANERY